LEFLSCLTRGFFFLYDGDGDASEKISYVISLPSKIEGGNVRGFSCYNARDYKNLDDRKRSFLLRARKSHLKLQKVLHMFLLMHEKKESEDYRRASTPFFISSAILNNSFLSNE
jgi:hypothetical protein